MAPATEDDDRPIGTNYTDKGPKPERGRSVNLLFEREIEIWSKKSVKICVKLKFANLHTRFLKFDHLEWWVGNAKQVGGIGVMVMVKMSWWDWCLWVWRPSSWWCWLCWRAINFAIMVLTDPKSFRPPPSTVPGSALSPLPIRWVVFVSTLPLLDFSCSRLGLESLIPWYFFLGREKN